MVGSEEFDDQQQNEELRQIENHIKSWLSSDVAEGFVRFFYGTVYSSAITRDHEGKLHVSMYRSQFYMTGVSRACWASLSKLRYFRSESRPYSM
jgi:hypothetical protein